jgi:hypothetical protein
MRKIKKITLAISADAAMSPVKPRRPAMIAMIKNVTTHPSILYPPLRVSPVEDRKFLNKFTIRETTNKIKKMIKMTFAISADAAITPENPKIPAMRAMMKNVIAQPSIFLILWFVVRTV